MLKQVDRRLADIIGLSWTNKVKKNNIDKSYITIEAPVFDTSGYASSTRNLIKGLIELKSKISVQPRWFKGAVDVVTSFDEAAYDNYLILKDEFGNTFKYLLLIDLKETEQIIPFIHNNIEKEYFIIHMAPYSYGCDHFGLAVCKNKGYKTYVGSTMFETDRLPRDWVRACNQMDIVFVPSEFNVKTFSNSGVNPNKIRKVPLGVDTNICSPGRYPQIKKWENKFVFLSVFEWNIRKGWDILIKAFCLAFNNNDHVILVIRSSSNKKSNIKEMIFDYIKEENLSVKMMNQIILIDKKLDFSSVYSLYESCDAFVLPSRGEGWGMTYLEAMAFGKPVIGTNWSGNVEFMTPENSFLIEIEKEEYVSKDYFKDNVCFSEGHKYAKPSLDHLIELLKYVYQNPLLRNKIAQKGLLDAHEKWNHVDYGNSVLNSIGCADRAI